MGDTQSGLTSKSTVVVNIQSLYDPNFTLQIKAQVLNKVTSFLPEKRFVLPKWAGLGRIKLADPQCNTPNKIDVLLGSALSWNRPCYEALQGVQLHKIECGRQGHIYKMCHKIQWETITVEVNTPDSEKDDEIGIKGLLEERQTFAVQSISRIPAHLKLIFMSVPKL